jgi:hypothetical protein
MLERSDVVTEEAVDDLVVVGPMKSRAPAISAKHGGCMMIDHLIVLSSANKNICHSAHLDIPAGALPVQPPYISTCVFSSTRL